MGANSKIEWCHHTFNPWIGCQPVSMACDFCYAEAQNKFRGWVDGWGPHGERRRTAPANWRQPLKWAREAKECGVRERVFCASLADVFDNKVPAEWRRDLFQLIWETCDSLDWLLLTKRPQNITEMVREAIKHNTEFVDCWPWANVWLGTTVENQEEAWRRIPILLQTPAALRFLSCEPLLGPVDIHLHLPPPGPHRPKFSEPAWAKKFPKIDWVIAGGESGPGARPMLPDWARSLRDQCAKSKVPYLFKQWGAWAPADIVHELDRRRFREMEEWVEPTNGMYLVGKSYAGRLLDGREHTEFPRVAARADGAK